MGFKPCGGVIATRIFDDDYFYVGSAFPAIGVGCRKNRREISFKEMTASPCWNYERDVLIRDHRFNPHFETEFCVVTASGIQTTLPSLDRISHRLSTAVSDTGMDTPPRYEIL